MEKNICWLCQRDRNARIENDRIQCDECDKERQKRLDAQFEKIKKNKNS